MVWFEGNYQDYEADRHKRLDTDPDQPHRMRFKRPAVALARRFASDAARDLPGLHVLGNSPAPSAPPAYLRRSSAPGNAGPEITLRMLFRPLDLAGRRSTMSTSPHLG